MRRRSVLEEYRIHHEALADVVSGDSHLNELQIEIDYRCFTLVALFQPAAVDLRTIVSTLRINADLERVGDLAVNIAEAGATRCWWTSSDGRMDGLTWGEAPVPRIAPTPRC